MTFLSGNDSASQIEEIGRVYFAQAQPCGYIKIGYTQCAIENRLRRLRHDMRLGDIEINADTTISCIGYAIAKRRMESEFHRKFASANIYGEWFTPTEDIMAFIATHCEPYDTAREKIEATRENKLKKGCVRPARVASDISVFIEKIGRENLQKACNVTLDATYRWQRAGIIPRKYHPALEVLARDKGCFTLWKKIAGKK